MKHQPLILGSLLMLGFGPAACSQGAVDYKTFPSPNEDLKLSAAAGPQTVILAGGCFWCTEAVYQNVPGVIGVVSGYAGGTKETADYEAVCTGTTNHAEAIEITYDPAVTSLGKLLKVFFSLAHDPTTLNRQGADRGRQYRSAIFYVDDKQKHVADAYIKQLNDAKVYDSPIVTTLEPLNNAFYKAEDYHQNYANQHPGQPYVAATALPKVAKVKKAELDKEQPATAPTH